MKYVYECFTYLIDNNDNQKRLSMYTVTDDETTLRDMFGDMMFKFPQAQVVKITDTKMLNDVKIHFTWPIQRTVTLMQLRDECNG